MALTMKKKEHRVPTRPRCTKAFPFTLRRCPCRWEIMEKERPNQKCRRRFNCPWIWLGQKRKLDLKPLDSWQGNNYHPSLTSAMASGFKWKGFPGGSDGKESSCNAGNLGSIPAKIPWRRAGQPTPVFLPRESPWTEEPGRLSSMGLQRVRHD